MIDDEGMARVLRALNTLGAEINENTISPSAATLITTAAEIEQRTILPNDEKVGGVVVVTVGTDRGVNMVLEGEFLPTLAYGAMVETILQLWSTSQRQTFEAPIKSMVAEMLGQAASLEKGLTKPDEH